MAKLYLLSLLLLLLSWRALADSAWCDTLKKQPADTVQEQNLNVMTYENNLAGYTWDSDDSPFLDITLSVAFRLANLDQKFFGQHNLHFYFSFTGRLGQYIGDRYSSPVVGKRFNPQFYFEYQPKRAGRKNSKFRYIYGHESNGQSIDSASVFYAAAKSNGGNINQTIDYISRGWDYVGFTYVRDIWSDKDNVSSSVFELQGDSRYYLNWGFFEGTKEEYRSWESAWYGHNYTRNDVSGLAMAATFFMPKTPTNKAFGFYKCRLAYETGITNSFTANSFKVMAVVRFLYLPLAFSYANGYNGDIAQYGKRNSSISISYVLTSFDRPFNYEKVH